MRIKKVNTNDYLLTEDSVWVRNFCNLESRPLDINDSLTMHDANLFIKNEFYKKKKKIQNLQIISSTNKVVIVSDGYDFEKKQKILAKLPFNEVSIFATNGALTRWQLVGKNSELQRAISWYVVNNPYPECLKFLPLKHSYYPPCIASNRTYPNFIEQYKGGSMLYCPVNSVCYSGLFRSMEFMVDDYRNPICAAIVIAYRMGVKKLLLLCCDDSFEAERPASEQLENGLWTYPQQLMSQNIIDGNLFWLKKAGVEIANCSSGKKFNNAIYITTEQITEFFNDE
jgi:hypothetical protein